MAHRPAPLKSAILRTPLTAPPDLRVTAAIQQIGQGRSNLIAAGAARGEGLEAAHPALQANCLIVVENEQVVGILTGQDVVRLCAQRQLLASLRLEQVMTQPVVTLPEADFTDLSVAINLLQQHRIHHLPLLDSQGHLVGLVTPDSLRPLGQPFDLLQWRVAEVMTREVVCAPPESSLLAIAQQMADHGVSAVVMVVSGNSPAAPLLPVGILTERDLVRFQALNLPLESYPAKVVMSTPLFYVTPEEPLWVVQQTLQQNFIHQVIVVGDQGELLGLVNQASFLATLDPPLTQPAIQIGLDGAPLGAQEIYAAALEHQVASRTAALQVKAEREQLMAQIAKNVHTSLNLQEILEVCVAEVRAFLECDRVLIFQFQADWSGIITAESVGRGWRSALENQIHDACFQRQAQTLYSSDQPAAIADIYSAGYTDCHLQLLERYQVKANLVVPIRVAGQLWGLLIGHQCSAARPWQGEDLTLFQDISVQLAIALQQATIYQQLQRELQERQQAEARLRESEQRYATLIEATPVGIFRTDAAGNCTYVNDRWSQITGLSLEAATEEGWHQRLHPEDREQTLALWQRSVALSQPACHEFRYQHPNGEVVWVYGQSVAERDSNGQVISFVGTLTDISDRKQAELALADSERSLSTLIHNLPGYVYRVQNNPDYTPEFISSGVEAITGYRPEEYLIERSISCGQEIHPEDARRVWETVQTAVHRHQTYECEYRITAKSGEEKWVWERGSGLYSEQGKLLFLEGFVTDITARKQSEAALQKTEKQFREAQRIAHLGNWELDLRNNTLHWSDEVFQIFEIDPQVFGASYEAFLNTVHPEDRDRVTDAYTHSLRDRSTYSIVHRLLLPDGRIKYVQEQCETSYSAEGTPILSQGTVQDITNLKQTELALERLNAELEARVAQRTDQLLEREAQLQDFFDNANDLIQSVGLADGRFEYVNRAWCETLGYTPTEVTALTIFDILQPDCQAHCRQLMAQMQAGTLDKLDQVELIFLTRHGQEIIVEGNINCRTEHTVVEGVQHEHRVATRAIFRDITERKVAEKQLQEREARYRALMDGASDAIMLADQQGNLLEVNHKAEELLGYTRAELTSMHFTQLHPPAELASIITAFERLAKQQFTQVLDVNFCRKDGSQVPVDISASALEIHGERIIQGIFRDISDRKRAEAALRESETRFRRVFDSNVVGIMFTDFSGQVTDANEQFLTMLGYSHEDLATQRINWATMTPVEYSQQDREIIEYLKHHQAIAPWEKAYYHKDGHLVPVLLGVALLPGENGSCVCIVVDISERKQSENALRESQQFLQIVLDAFPLAVFWKNRESVYLGCNQHFAETSGLTSPQEVIGKTDFDFSYTEAEASAYRNDDQWVMQSGEAKLEIEETLTLASGEYIWLETNKIPLRSLTGEVIGILGTFQDISDRKQAEEQLQLQARYKQLLWNITQTIRQSLELDLILTAAVREIRQLLGVDRATVYRFQANWSGEFITETVADGWVNLVASEVNQVWEDTYLQETQGGRFRQHETLVVPDIYQTDLQPCHIELLEKFQARAYVITPIFVGASLWGLFAVYQNGGSHGWADWEIELLQQVASQLSIAIYQANLYEQVQSELIIRQQAEAAISQQLQRQRTLGVIAQRIRESLDINEILATVTQEVKAVMHCDRAIVFRLFANGQSQIVEEAVADSLPSLKERSWDNEVWSQDILDCYWQGQPRIVPDVMDDLWTDCLVEYSLEGQIQSKIVAPILQEVHTQESHRWIDPSEQNKLWGILVVHACQEKRVWQESEAQLLQQIANQLAIAIQQANLFHQLQQELTERQQAQRQLLKSNEQLAISNEELARVTRLKDEFLANMSHELRTPLNAILGMAEALQEQVFGTVTPAQIQALQTIDRSGSHLLDLINDILDLAKIESGQIELTCNTTAVLPLCQFSLVFIKHQALQKDIQVDLQLPANLPDLWVDERYIRQVLINLLNNAVKFTPNGGRITLAGRYVAADPAVAASPAYLQISVSDTGIGIAPENRQNLFQPFVQIDSTLNRQYAGTGLGLALVKRIIELHGGSVGLTSALGQGSCFTIQLPYPVQAPLLNPSAEPVPLDRDVPGPDPTPVSAPLILLVEDNEANIFTLSGYLKAKGFRLLIARHGQEAIALTQAHHPNLILMDIQMPGMDGLEATQRIRALPEFATLPIIALTALAMAGDRERCLAAGADDYLAKPVKLKQLVATIQKVLARGK